MYPHSAVQMAKTNQMSRFPSFKVDRLSVAGKTVRLQRCCKDDHCRKCISLSCALVDDKISVAVNNSVCMSDVCAW